MFVEQRIYSFAPGNTGVFLKTYESDALAAQTGALGQPVGYYVNEIGPLNQITTMWAYGSLDERVERRRNLFNDPVWQAFLKKCRPLMTTQETRVLIPAPFFQERLKAIAALGEAVMTSARKFGLGVLALLALATSAAAQEFPSRPIKFVVPLAAGGGIDFTARVTAQKLSEVIGQQVVVENQGGGGGSIGVNQVVRATPDGYTLLYHSVTGIVNAAVAKDLPFDYLRDLVPVALVTRFAAVMVINPGVPAKDLKEFIALAKANPGKFSYGSSGAGTGIHLASELFKLAAGVDIVHVPYRGNAGVMPDLLAGRIQMLIDGVPPQVKNIEGGLVRALGVLSRTRTPALPDVPTMIEQGLDYEVPYWTAVYAPAGTPKPIVDKLSAEIAKAMKDGELIGKLRNAGTEAVGSTPAEMDAFNRQQFDLYRKIVQNPNLKLGLQ